MNKPNFFIIGAPRCGTTSLAAWLSSHPQVYIPPAKEIHFYCSDFNPPGSPKTEEEYLRYFSGAAPSVIAVGEASALYLASQTAIPSIEERYPESKYIVMVRNPVDMAHSLHGDQLFGGEEDVADFLEAWRLSCKRREGALVPKACPDGKLLDYQAFCRLGEQLQRLFGIVPRERVLVLLLDDIRLDARREYSKVLAFLGLADDNRKSFPVKNQAKEVRWRWLRSLVKGLVQTRILLGIPPLRKGIYSKLMHLNARPRQRPPLPEWVRQELLGYYREDIMLLSRLIGRNFEPWLRGGRWLE